MRELELRLSAGRPRNVPVRVGAGALDLLAEDLAVRSPKARAIVVSDSNVAALHGEPLCGALRAKGVDASLVVFPAGEASKSRETKASVEDRLIELGADRDTVLVALGGGVVGDLVGFVAATWHRGVPVVLAPTSLLAMVDAAVGGKTGVDLPGGKNLVGAFHQPAGIYADISVLATLPEEEFRSGFAEVVKAAVVADAGLFLALEGRVPALLDREPETLCDVLASCIRIKSRIVSRDERESGRRAILNFGHTVAHAIETVSGYRISHGHAVAVGMVVEARLAGGITGFPERQALRLESLLDRLGLPVRWPAAIAIDEAIEVMRKDKKNRAGAIHFSLPVRIGRMIAGPEVTRAVDEDPLRTAIEKARGR